MRPSVSMSYVCTLHETPETGDLRGAIDRCLALWALADVSPETRVHLLVQTTHRAVAHAIAELLPPDTRGFASVHHAAENRTAADILAVNTSNGVHTWNGSFANDISPELIRPLLLRLRELPPDPLRRTSLNLQARNVRWHGSPAHAHGNIALADAKVFQRRVRFHVALAYETRDGLSKQDIQAELKAVAEATGIDFSTGNCLRQSEGAAWATERVARATLLFHEVVERVSQSLLRDHFDWSQLPGAFAHGQGMRRRFLAIAQGSKEEFRWDADVSELMRTVLPEFRAKKGLFADAKTYVAPFHAPWAVAVVLDTHPGLRVGRIFKLRCGIVANENGNVRYTRSAPLLRCSGGSYHESTDTCPEFSFNTRAELAAILGALGRFLPDFLARFRSGLEEVLLPGCVDFTRVFPALRHLTADMAFQAASAFLRQQGFDQAELIGASLSALPHALVYRQDPAAGLPANGASDLLYHWSVKYVFGSTSLEVFLPSAGTPALSRTEMEWLELNPHLAPKPLSSPLVNSDHAARRMHEKCAELRARYPDMYAVIGALELKYVDDKEAWTAQIEFSSLDPESHDWVLVRPAIDAMTGELFRTEFDERFCNAAVTQRTFTEQ